MSLRLGVGLPHTPQTTRTRFRLCRDEETREPLLDFHRSGLGGAHALGRGVPVYAAYSLGYGVMVPCHQA